MWWLDDGPSGGINLQSDPPDPLARDSQGGLLAIQPLAVKTGNEGQASGLTAADASDELASHRLQAQEEAAELLRQLADEQALRSAAETQLAETSSQHLEQLAALQLEIQTLEETIKASEVNYNELAATIDQREADHVEQLAEMNQARQDSEDALRESESQQAVETQSLRSELESLRGSLKENEAARSDFEARLEQRDLAHAAELAALTQQTESLQSQLRTLEQTLVESETARANLQAAVTERDATLASQLVESERARENATVREGELTAQIESLEAEAATLQSRLDTETKSRAAADCALEQCRALHAAELTRLQEETQSLQQTCEAHEALRREAKAAAEQREAECSHALVEAGQAREAAQQRAKQLEARLEAMDIERAALQTQLETEIQGHVTSATQRRELERQHARQTESLQSKLLILEKLVQEHEAARRESDSELTRSKEEYATELAKWDEARESAEQRNTTLELQRRALQHQLESSSARADKESESRVAAEAEVQRMADELRQLSDEAERTRDDYVDLQRHSAEQRELLATGFVQLQQELDDRERKLRERDLQIARQATELEQRRERERRLQLEKKQHCEQHAEQIAAFETQVAELRSQAEAERMLKMRLEHVIEQLAEELGQQLAEESQLRLKSQTLVTDLRMECARRELELDQLRDASALATEAEKAAERRIKEEIDKVQTLQQQLESTRSSAAETEARKTSELVEMRTALTTHASELAASREQIEQMQQQLKEAIQRNKDDQASRQRAEALADALTQDVALQQKRVEAFRGFAQREAAARRKLEVAIKRSDDSADNTAAMLAIRAHIEANERIRRLTAELTAARNQELSVRQRALREIKRAQEEVQQLKHQLANERKAA